MSKKKDDIGLATSVCPICKKKYIQAPLHAWKINNVRVCSYTCMRKEERRRGWIK